MLHQNSPWLVAAVANRWHGTHSLKKLVNVTGLYVCLTGA